MSDLDNRGPAHFLVFIPGILGSRLRNKKTGKTVWVDFNDVPANPLQWNQWLDHIFEELRYPNDDLEPAGIMDKLVFMPPWVKQEIYGRLVTALQGMGYKADPSQYAEKDRTLYTFDYDWRQDNRKSAAQLGEAIARWQSYHPGAQPWIIAHSNGGLVARWYIEKLGGKQSVGRLFLIASPWDGSPKALRMLFDGVVFLRQWQNVFDIADRTRHLVRSWPCVYQLLPHRDPFLRGKDNEVLTLSASLDWLDAGQRALLQDGLHFTEELDKATSVETLCFFGRGQATDTSGTVHIRVGGSWDTIDWGATDAGDGTVPERAAVLPTSQELLPFAATHGEIYVNADVLQKLQWELIGRYQLGVLAEVTAGGFTVTFNPDKDAYAPGEPIQVVARVSRADTGTSVTDAEVTAKLVWRDALPGSPIVMAEPSTARLERSVEVGGSYTGTFTAPATEGYYRIEAEVIVPGAAPVNLSELILVESLPAPTAASVGAPPEPEMVLGLPELEPLPSSRELDEVPPGAGFESLGSSVQHAAGEDLSFGGIAVAEEATGNSGASTEEQRFLHATIEDQPEEQPLQVGKEYTLAFSVDKEDKDRSARLPSSQQLFMAGEDEIALTVRLDSSDFEIGPAPQQLLRLPRTGPSLAPARFTIKPKQEGQGVITVVVLKENNYVLAMSLKLGVGSAETAAVVDVQKQLRSLAGTQGLQPRELNLFIEPGQQGFRITSTGAFTLGATLPIQLESLAQMIERARQALFGVVDTLDSVSNSRSYQSGIDISPEINRQSITKLALVGWRLYQELFFGDAADAQANKFGRWLRLLAQENTLRIQIVSNEFVMPWGLLYVAERFEDNNIQPELFLGLKHIIEHLPIQTGAELPSQKISTQPKLTVSVNVNTDIDTQLHTTVIADQIAFWDKIHKRKLADVVVRRTKAEVTNALADGATVDQILYFYCHAGAPSAGDPLGPDGASLYLTGKERLTLDDLRRMAPAVDQLPGTPLVFINACESAELSPLFYRGFMPYLVRKGARGMIGTECQVPALFAKAWADAFFDQFLMGEKPLGQIFLDLRRDFYFNHKNILGLVYSLYCNGDLQVEPGLQLV